MNNFSGIHNGQDTNSDFSLYKVVCKLFLSRQIFSLMPEHSISTVHHLPASTLISKGDGRTQREYKVIHIPKIGLNNNNYYYIHLTAFFPEQPG